MSVPVSRPGMSAHLFCDEIGGPAHADAGPEVRLPRRQVRIRRNAAPEVSPPWGISANLVIDSSAGAPVRCTAWIRRP